MQIVDLNIANFKSIKQLAMPNLPRLAIIAGLNGSGKTALFAAIRVCKEAYGSYSVQNPGQVNPYSLMQELGRVIRAGEEEAIVKISFRVIETERQALTLPVEHSGVLLVGHAANN